MGIVNLAEEETDNNELIEHIVSDFIGGIEHGILVGNLAYCLAVRMCLSKEESYELKLAGMLHDVGKIKLSKYLYGRNTDNFSVEEIKYMRMHSKISYDVLKKYEYSDNIMNVVLSHHECFDGSGYPGNLKGDDIPLGARILKVVDSFAALISDRPYRKAFDMDTAMDIMIENIKNVDMKVFIEFQRMIHDDETIEIINNSKLCLDDLDLSDILNS
ncbi:MAG: HD-GYP domain-containing protein [Lachnospira sp.]